MSKVTNNGVGEEWGTPPWIVEPLANAIDAVETRSQRSVFNY